MKISKEQAIKLGKKHKINFNVINLSEWWSALNIETEHNLSITRTVKTVLDHLKEYPDYYKFLIKLEKNREKFWKNKLKPDIFL